MKQFFAVFGSALVRLLAWLTAKTRDQVTNVHMPRLRSGENVLRLCVGVLIMIVLLPSTFQNDWRLALGFLGAALLAIWNGWIYRERGAMVLVFAGAAIGSLCTGLLRDMFAALRKWDYTSFLVIGVLAAFIWYIARDLKQGRRPRL
jgi:hypothetical protein